MDVVLNLADTYFFSEYVYPTSWPVTSLSRQFISLMIITMLGGAVLYLVTATFSYHFIFDHRLLKHPQVLENQVQKEITYALKSVPLMALPTVLIFMLEVNGYSKLYNNVHDTKLGWAGIVLSIFTFILFTDWQIYWIHRWLHHRLIYKFIHKDHHRWKVPTPFASHAFHPIDGFLQSCPYHIYPFLFPLHKYTYLILFVCVNIWTVSIHDGDYRVPSFLQPFVNGSAHHMDHHLFYNYNYGQYFTLWDRIGGSFRNPSAYEGKGPLDELLKKELNADGYSDKKEK